VLGHGATIGPANTRAHVLKIVDNAHRRYSKTVSRLGWAIDRRPDCAPRVECSGRMVDPSWVHHEAARTFGSRDRRSRSPRPPHRHLCVGAMGAR
jgi:hypothetical protein